MSCEIEGAIVPTVYPVNEYQGQLALWVDAWAREWRACLGTIGRSENGVLLGQVMFFRGDTLQQLEDDDGYPPHLRICGREELDGARKLLQRLLCGNPRAIAVIEHHLEAEGVMPVCARRMADARKDHLDAADVGSERVLGTVESGGSEG